MERIKHKILVIGGKGGVGKSTVAVNLAYALSVSSKVGLLDTDIHGPNIAKMLGIGDGRMSEEGGRLKPVERLGMLVASTAFLLPETDTPVIWRGPLKGKLIGHFLSDVDWGPLDYLIVDLPPGTGDEALSAAQLIPEIDGVVVVTTPQEVSLMDSRKAINFAKQMGIPVIGVVENMSGYVCPGCGERMDIFKRGGGEQAAAELGMEFLGRIPIIPGIVESCDSGIPFLREHGKTLQADPLNGIVEKIKQCVERR